MDRPIRSLSRSLNNLALAGEGKSVIILADVVDDIELDNLKNIDSKLKTIQNLDL